MGYEGTILRTSYWGRYDATRWQNVRLVRNLYVPRLRTTEEIAEKSPGAERAYPTSSTAVIVGTSEGRGVALLIDIQFIELFVRRNASRGPQDAGVRGYDVGGGWLPVAGVRGYDLGPAESSIVPTLVSAYRPA